VPPLAVSVTLPPAQKVVGPEGVMVAVGSGLTVTVCDVGAEVHELASVTVTVYVPDVDTVMAAVVAPVDQRYEVPPEAVSVTLPPAQNVVGPDGVMVAVGSGLTVTVCEAGADMHELASVTVTVYVPEVDTAIAAVVAPVDQRYDVPPEAVSVTLPPAQKVVGPDGVMVAVGSGLTVTVCDAGAEVQELASVVVTV
jgi:archaellum component FlaF (FlaF/FlaG flagellin family)